MGFFDFFKRKCSFCGKTDELLRYVAVYACDSYVRRYYHIDCWKKVLESPQDYLNTQVDFALKVSNGLLEEKQRRKRIEEEKKKALEEAQERVKELTEYATNYNQG